MLPEWFIWTSSFLGGFIILATVIVLLYYATNVFPCRKAQCQPMTRRPWVECELEKYSIVKTQNSLSIIDVSNNVSEQQTQEHNTSDVTPLSPTSELVEIPLTPLYPNINTIPNTLCVPNTKTKSTTPKLRKFNLLSKKQGNSDSRSVENENEKCEDCGIIEKVPDGACIESSNKVRPLTIQEKAKYIQKQYSKVFKQAWGKVKATTRYGYSNSTLLPTQA